VGSAILWSPFYLASDAGVRLARLFGSEVEADGYSRPYIAAVTYASALYGFLALLISVAAASRIIAAAGGRQDETSLATAVLAVWLGTPLLFYMYLAPGFSHACSAFAVAAFVLLWLHVRTSWSLTGVMGLGAMAALMGMVREQDLFIAIGPAVDYAVTVARSSGPFPDARTAIVRAAAGLFTCAVCYLPQIASYQVLYGRPAPSPSVERKMTWTSPHAWQVLASPENGLLFWTPLALAALVAGIPRGRPRYLLHAFSVLAIWWNLGLMAQFGTGMMSRQHMDLPRVTYNNFVTVPRRAPEFVYRYVADRESFYRWRTSPAP